MTALDTLARGAAAAVNESVAHVQAPVAGTVVATGSAAAWRMVGYAAAGAAAGVAVVALLIVAPPSQEEATQESTPPSTAVVSTTLPPDVTTTTIGAPETVTSLPAPETDAPVVIPPVIEDPPAAPPDTEPPALRVVSPVDGDHRESEKVTFAGTTDPGARVTASGKFAAKVASDGSWSIDLMLAPGANGVVFASEDDAGNTTEVRLTVYYDVEKPPEEPPEEPPKKTTTTTEVTWEFTANQTYGSCSEPIAYDEFFGKAKPGSTVSVSSEFGGGSTVAGDDGTYWIKVDFPSAPFGKVFAVKVKGEFGGKKVFDFVSNYSG